MSLCRRATIFLLTVSVGCVLYLITPSSAAAQQSKGKSQPKSADAGNVVIGTVAAERGTSAAIPIYYQPGKSKTVSSLHLVLEFVSNSIKFTKAEKGVAGEGQDFNIVAEVKELPPDDKKILHSQLTLDVSLPEGSSKKFLPEGLLSFLNFKIPEDAKPFSISLTPLTLTAQDSSKKPVEVAVEAGKVIVSIPDAPLAGCFFFTH